MALGRGGKQTQVEAQFDNSGYLTDESEFYGSVPEKRPFQNTRLIRYQVTRLRSRS